MLPLITLPEAVRGKMSLIIHSFPVFPTFLRTQIAGTGTTSPPLLIYLLKVFYSRSKVNRLNRCVRVQQMSHRCSDQVYEGHKFEGKWLSSDCHSIDVSTILK